MIGLAKQFIVRSLDRVGYRLLKNAEYSRLLAARAPSAQPLPLEPMPDPIASSPSANQGQASADFPPGEADFRLFLKHARNLSGHSALCTLAVYSAVRYLTQTGIEGAAVDCGSGDASRLAIIAAALSHLKDTNRQLVLFDVTADPLHRAEAEMELWGSERDLLSAPAAQRRLPHREQPPPELLSGGYPAEKMSIRRYPREPLVQSDPVAFLALTSESYPANRAAIAAFVPQLVRGGVILVEGDAVRPDAVDQFLSAASMNLFFVPISSNRRIAIKL